VRNLWNSWGMMMLMLMMMVTSLCDIPMALHVWKPQMLCESFWIFVSLYQCLLTCRQRNPWVYKKYKTGEHQQVTIYLKKKESNRVQTSEMLIWKVRICVASKRVPETYRNNASEAISLVDEASSPYNTVELFVVFKFCRIVGGYW
jgi:hypothetical protein